MIELHQYPAIWGLPSLSPFCIKVELFLRRFQIPHNIVVKLNPARGPKGKMPFICDGTRIVSDSTLILQYLLQNRKLNGYKEPNPRLQAQGLAFQRMIEEFLYFILLYSRWIDPVGWAVVRRDFPSLFPPLVGTPFMFLIRSNLTKQAFAQGVSRHSHAEIYEIGRKDLEALSVTLGSQPFLMGDEWTVTDATLYAFLITILKQPIQSELKIALLEHKNLLYYCQREEQMYFPELVEKKSESP